ncbi:hypothetical protein AB4084_00965, partial [Lysobacter sp. 2RAB21]
PGRVALVALPGEGVDLIHTQVGHGGLGSGSGLRILSGGRDQFHGGRRIAAFQAGPSYRA